MQYLHQGSASTQPDVARLTYFFLREKNTFNSESAPDCCGIYANGFKMQQQQQQPKIT